MLKQVAIRTVLAITLVVVAGLAYFVFLSPYKLYVVHTGSMGQTIPSRSAVIVHMGEYHTGQVISFRVNGEVVTHRLMAIRSDGTITTKGDANTTVDPWHPPKENIIGGVVMAPRMLGWWLYYLFRSIGGISVLAAIALICLLWSSDKKPIAVSEPTTTP
jgi:signal peptidase